MADACYKRRNGKMDLCEDSRQLSVHSASKRNVEVQKTALRACADWTEHLSSSGRIYYYNSKTEVSRWDKPKEWGIKTHAIVLNNVKVELSQSRPVDPRHATRSDSKQAAIDDPTSTQVRTVDKNVAVPEHSSFSYPLTSTSTNNGCALTPYQWNVKNMPNNCRQWRDIGSTNGSDGGTVVVSWGLPLTCNVDPRLVNRELTRSTPHDASNAAACANTRLPACSQLQQHVAGRRLPTAQLTPTLAKHFSAHLIRHSNGWTSDSIEKQIELICKKRHKLCCQHGGYNGLELKRARALVQLADTRATAKEHRISLLQQRLMVVESVSTVGVTSTTADLATVASL